MPLSEYEQRVLEQMERQLTSDDPRLANTLTARGRKPLGRFVLAAVGAIIGLLLLVFGAAIPQAWLGVVGFVIMFAAVAFAFAKPRATGPRGAVQADGRVAAPKKPHSAGLMSRLDDRWQRRRDQGDR